MSPLFSVSAFLHSIMPAPVRSRSSLTREAVISAMEITSICVWMVPGRRTSRPRHRGEIAIATGAPYKICQRPRSMARPRCAGLTRRLGLSAAVVGSATSALASGQAFAVGGGSSAFLAGGLLAPVRGRAGLPSAPFGEVLFAHGGGVGAAALPSSTASAAARAYSCTARMASSLPGIGVVDQGRVVVGVDHGDHRDAELLGFLDGDVFMADVDHEQRVGQAVHVLDAAQRGVQLLALAAQAQHFVLDQLLEGAVGLGRLPVPSGAAPTSSPWRSWSACRPASAGSCTACRNARLLPSSARARCAWCRGTG